VFLTLLLLSVIENIFNSVRPILCIGEYSLVALQYRQIQYIGLRVSADTDTPAAITINSNRTWRLKHMVRVSASTECDYKWGWYRLQV